MDEATKLKTEVLEKQIDEWSELWKQILQNVRFDADQIYKPLDCIKRLMEYSILVKKSFIPDKGSWIKNYDIKNNACRFRQSFFENWKKLEETGFFKTEDGKITKATFDKILKGFFELEKEIFRIDYENRKKSDDKDDKIEQEENQLAYREAIEEAKENDKRKQGEDGGWEVL